jgi:predicted SprT family Zn-dependent metalloprotease
MGEPEAEVMTTLEGMNRAESRLYRMQEKVLGSARWAKMVRRVDFGKEVAPYKLVPVKLNGRMKASNAWAFCDAIEFSKDYYKRATPKNLMNTMKHEMVHTFLSQNRIPDKHSTHFKTCCHVLGLHRPDHMEGTYNYQHICTECGWWRKSMKRQDKLGHVCKGSNFKFLVTRTEYQKLARIAKVGSKVCPVNIEAYQVMEVKRIRPNLKLKEDSG